MKRVKNILYTLFAVSMLSACSDDEVNFSFQELRNEAYDLAIVSDAEPYVNVGFSISGSLSEISISITPEEGGEAVSTRTIDNFTRSSLNRLNIEVPFPTPDVASSGRYQISYSLNNNEIEGSYPINIINNRGIPVSCTFSEPPSGQVAVRLSVPNGATLGADEVLYLSGSFEDENGGPEEWTGGGDAGGVNAFTKLDDTCYEIFVTLSNGDEMKVTRGNWDKQRYDGDGNEYGNFKYEGGNTIDLIAENWKDLPKITPIKIPAVAIVPGMLTVTVDIGGNEPADSTYYIVAEGETDLANGFLMTPYEEGNRLAVAVPKDDAVNYIIVKDDLTAIGTNAGGAIKSVAWDGQTNPASFAVTNFDGGLENMYMTGSATDGWTGGANFVLPKVSAGVFEATFTINGDSEYLFLPSPGDFNNKYGLESGDASAGTLVGPGAGGNLNTNGLTSGDYVVTIDFNNDPVTYTLVPASN